MHIPLNRGNHKLNVFNFHLIFLNLVPPNHSFNTPHKMLSQFIARGLYKTIDFLNNIKMDIPTTNLELTKEEVLFTVYYNLKEYKKCYFLLLCPQSQSHVEQMVFCTCCSKLKVFMRNYALLTVKKNVSLVSHTGDRDEFLLYLEGIVLKDYTKLVKAIEMNNLFWDAYLELVKLTNLNNVDYFAINSQLSDFFYMFLFCSKFITRKFKLMENYPNLLAAVYYHKRDFAQAEAVFKSIVKNPVYFDLTYIDLYSNILYVNKDPEVGVLAQRALEINRYRPEALCCIANYHSLLGEHTKAIEYYGMCLRINPGYSLVYTLIGNEFLEEREVMKAIGWYNSGVKNCNEDYRAWYNLGRAYESLSMSETALYFYKKAAEYRKNDFLIWKSLGSTYLSLNDFENAIRCYKRVFQLKEPEGYLLIAEVYKILKKYSDCVEYYEKYVNSLEALDNDSKKICSFLEEYFRKVCDVDKSLKYKEMANY